MDTSLETHLSEVEGSSSSLVSSRSRGHSRRIGGPPKVVAVALNVTRLFLIRLRNAAASTELIERSTSAPRPPRDASGPLFWAAVGYHAAAFFLKVAWRNG